MSTQDAGNLIVACLCRPNLLHDGVIGRFSLLERCRQRPVGRGLNVDIIALRFEVRDLAFEAGDLRRAGALAENAVSLGDRGFENGIDAGEAGGRENNNSPRSPLLSRMALPPSSSV
ncbi:MAG: hypothetical protein M9939_23585 [Mesorhizobium sp.]|nr:hypothetical protein [Mesorhizobium sp.]MCO5164086.1 hypothetical protein [Mesorhizobium sp.]